MALEEQKISKEILGTYNEYSQKRLFFFLLSLILLVFLALFSLTLGPANVSITEALSTLTGTNTSSRLNTIIWNIRVPRVLAAIAAGAGLAVVGVAMQTILRNPLGSPFTLGISHAAAFGAAFSIIVLGAGTTQSSRCSHA